MNQQKVNAILAFKAVALAPNLKGSDRRIACVLLDHFNRKTGQCDPSLNTLAVLAGLSRRTAIRSIETLVALGYFGRVRHGGNFHRNFYTPIWTKFQESERLWMARRRLHKSRFGTEKLSPSECQQRQLGDDRIGTQTCFTNQSYVTIVEADFESRPSPTRRKSQRTVERNTSKARCDVSSSEAAATAAERRWLSQLQSHFLSLPELYARVVDAIDETFRSQVTAAEQSKPGSGFLCAMERLRAAGVL